MRVKFCKYLLVLICVFSLTMVSAQHTLLVKSSYTNNTPVTEGVFTGTGFNTLQGAITHARANLTGEVEIELMENITEVVTIQQKTSLNLTIDGNGKTLTGQIRIDGDGRLGGTDKLVIKNLNFTFKSGTADGAFIYSLKDSQAYNTHGYTHNVTVADCNFDGAGSVSFRAVRCPAKGSAKNIILINVTAKNLFGLAEFRATSNITIQNCTATENMLYGVQISGGYGTHQIENNEFVATATGAYGIVVQDACSADITYKNNTITADRALVFKATSSAQDNYVESGIYNGTLEHTGVNKLHISGGTFGSEPADADIVSGYVKINNGDGTWSVTKVSNAIYVDKNYTTNGDTVIVDGNKGIGFQTLQAAVTYARTNLIGDAVIMVLSNLEEVVDIRQKEGLNLTINGANHSLLGQIRIDGDGRQSGTDILIIENINFKYVSTLSADYSGLIYFPTRNQLGRYNYAHNVTIRNCDFDGTGSTSFWAVNVPSGVSPKNIILENDTCHVLFGFASLRSTINATIRDCVVNNVSDGGIILGNCTGEFTIEDNKIDVNTTDPESYGVRVQDLGTTATITFEGNDIDAPRPLYFRNTGAGVSSRILSGRYAGGGLFYENANGDVKISGGTYSEEPVAENIVPGYAAFYNGNGTWSVYPISATITYIYGSDTIKQYKREDEAVTLYGESTFTKPDYALQKWNTQEDGNGTDYELESLYSDDNDLTLYPVWTLTCPIIEAITATPSTICYNFNSQLNIDLTDTLEATIAWTPATGLSATNVEDPSITALTETTTYTVTVTNRNSCTATATVTVTVNPEVVMNPVADREPHCAGDATSYEFSTPLTVGTMEYEWTNDNAAIGLATSGTGNISFIPTNTTANILTANITVTPKHTYNDIICEGDAITFTIKVLPTILADVNKNQYTCPGDINVELYYNECERIINLGTPTVPVMEGNAVTLTNNAPEGSVFSVGTTVVTWTATDACGDSITCDQTVVVSYPPCGEGTVMTDNDGNEYQTVRIGCQCWTKENIRTNADSATAYNNSDSLENIYGKLYTWYSAVAVAEGDNNAVPTATPDILGESYVQGICPEGWVLPTPDAFTLMLANGGNATNAKSDNNLYWLPNRQGVAPLSGFDALGAGNYNAALDRYENLLGSTNFWTSLNANAQNATSVEINYFCEDGMMKEFSKEDGLSVRCLKISLSPFTAQACPGTLTVTDVDGNVYNTVLIGEQCWMRENLRTTQYANGTPIALGTDTSTTTPFRYYPNNSNSTDITFYGYLYNWPAVMNGAASSNANPSGVQGVCPDGWHVPSTAEWESLMTYMNSQSQYVCQSGYTNSFAKSLADSVAWATNTQTCTVGYNLNENNATGFSARPAGYMSIRWNNTPTILNPINFGNNALFWSATETSPVIAGGYNIGYRDPNFIFSSASKYYGRSVRCVRD